jgi:16S rRNA (guanine966-N2)-methyltransferase
MGAEALCRGAAVVIGIESTPAACAVIEQNWHPLAREGQTIQVLRGDVVKRLPTLAGQSFDLIYLDPPYASDLYEPVMQLIIQHHLLAPTGELAVEHGLVGGPVNVPELTVCRQKRYGNTGLTFYRVANDG